MSLESVSASVAGAQVTCTATSVAGATEVRPAKTGPAVTTGPPSSPGESTPLPPLPPLPPELEATPWEPRWTVPAPHVVLSEEPHAAARLAVTTAAKPQAVQALQSW